MRSEPVAAMSNRATGQLSARRVGPRRWLSLRLLGGRRYTTAIALAPEVSSVASAASNMA
jgi:hypothetical protein